MSTTLYMNPVSTACRPVSLFIAEKNLPVTEQFVDLMKGEHHGAEFIAKNPCCLVPVLEEGDFRMAESSAILKYLANRFDAPEYPKDARTARESGRSDGLVQHAVLSRLRLWTSLPAGLPASQAPDRGAATGHDRPGAGTRRRRGLRYLTGTCWDERLRREQSYFDRRLLRRLPADGGRADRLYI